jgi:hypothetical protein
MNIGPSFRRIAEDNLYLIEIVLKVEKLQLKVRSSRMNFRIVLL